MNILHLHNGDASADAARIAGVRGEHIAWRESLVTGPTPLTPDRAAWIALRARHLSDAYGVPLDDCAAELARQESRLDACADFDELALWFDRELFCQTILWYLLARLNAMPTLPKRISLIARSPTSYITAPWAGRTPEAMRAMFDARADVTPEQVQAGAGAWQAYASADPRSIERLTAEQPNALPGLHRMARTHLARYPSADTGLGLVESLALASSAARMSFAEAFNRVHGSIPDLGYGDAQLWHDLLPLADAAHPLITISGIDDPRAAVADGTFRGAELALTDLGSSVLEGRADAVAANGIDRWLGGMHLFGASSAWRWDRSRARIVGVDDPTETAASVLEGLIDVSHTIEGGMITYKGLPAPIICDYMSREASREHYADGVEFAIGKIEMVANTGTYVDAPFHRYADGADLADLPLESLADLAGIVVRFDHLVHGRAIDAGHFIGLDVRGKAVLVHTGWDAHWRTDRYFEGHPFLTADAAAFLVHAGARLVGIDSLNIDDTDDRARPVHSTLLGAGIPIAEHLCNLGALPADGFRFHAAPIKIRCFGSFPVRAYAVPG